MPLLLHPREHASNHRRHAPDSAPIKQAAGNGTEQQQAAGTHLPPLPLQLLHLPVRGLRLADQLRQPAGMQKHKVLTRKQPWCAPELTHTGCRCAPCMAPAQKQRGAPLQALVQEAHGGVPLRRGTPDGCVALSGRRLRAGDRAAMGCCSCAAAANAQ